MNSTTDLLLSATQIHTSTPYSSTTSPSAPPYYLGQRVRDKAGRIYRYVKAGAADLVAGNVIQSPAPIANHINCAVTATALGATSIAVTPGATAGAANLYANGIVVVSTGPGLGAYGIRSHAAITASTEFTLNLWNDDPIWLALTTSSKVDLMQNPWSAVIQAPITTLTSGIVGVAVYPVLAGEYGFVQVAGPCAVLIDGTPAVGNLVSSPAAVAGGAAINSGTLTNVGTTMVVGVDAKCKLVNLQIG